jgi:hypothetical protein
LLALQAAQMLRSFQQSLPADISALKCGNRDDEVSPLSASDDTMLGNVGALIRQALRARPPLPTGVFPYAVRMA